MSSLKLVCILLVPSLAAADTGLSVRTGLAYWQPRGDTRELAEASPALRPEVTYAITPWLAAVAGFDWVSVDKSDRLVAGNAYYYAASLGARVMLPLHGRVQPLLAASLGRYSVHVDCLPSMCGGALVHDNTLGGRLDAGVSVAIRPAVHAQATIGYSHARFEVGALTSVERDIDALILDVGLGITL